MNTNKLLEIYNVSAYRDDKQVFSNVNLTINHGENVAILGPNGSGKSTLLKLLTREIYPVVKDNSYVKIHGSETVDVKQLREKIGMVSHDLQTNYPSYTTGFDVVMSGFFGAIGMIYSHFEINDDHIIQARQAIKRLGLSALENRLYQHMSTGEQRSFLLARAIIHKPDTLILDEPTSSLDIHNSFRLIKHMRQLAQQNTSIIMATHHIQEIIPEISRVILIKQGKIIADGDKASLLRNETLSALYDTNIEIVESKGFYQVYPA